MAHANAQQDYGGSISHDGQGNVNGYSGRQLTSRQKGLNPKTLWESNAYQHAMTPAAKIRELGNVGAAQEWPRREAVGFVEANLSEASRLYKQASQTRNGLEASFNAFGAAMHPVMDNASPTHTGFQIYDGQKCILRRKSNPAVGGVCN